jgi:hypothetical protein
LKWPTKADTAEATELVREVVMVVMEATAADKVVVTEDNNRGVVTQDSSMEMVTQDNSKEVATEASTEEESNMVVTEDSNMVVVTAGSKEAVTNRHHHHLTNRGLIATPRRHFPLLQDWIPMAI